MSVLACRDLTKRYRDKTALNGLTFAVERGEVFGLLGPNGAGKTTTFRILLGLSTPDSGTTTMLSEVGPPSRRVLACVGALIEEPAFYPWMTGRSLLRVATAGGRRVDIDALLDRVGLADARSARIRGYSQGMRQRLALAAALAREPELLILDEPANGLDPAGIRWLRELIGSLASQGTTILLSSHQLGEVERLCGQVVIVDHGSVVDLISTDHARALTKRVRVRIGSHSVSAAAAAALEGHRWRQEDEDSILIDDATVPEVLAALAAAGIYPDAIEREQASLEQRFFAATGRD